MKGLILAGGKGTRLRPLTYTRPKGLMPLVNKAFLEYQLELLRAHGVQDVVLSLSYMAEEFKKHFGDGSHWGINLSLCLEEKPLGTAGAIRHAVDTLIGSERVVVLNGDVLTDIDLTDMVRFHTEQSPHGTIALARVDNPTTYGLVVCGPDGRVGDFVEKPGWDEVSADTVNAGIYILEPSLVERIPKGREVSLERETFPELVAQDVRIMGYATRAYWLDIGTLPKYLQAHSDVLNGKVDVVFPGRRVNRGVRMGKAARVHPAARLVGPVVIGNHVDLEGNCRVGPWSVIGDRCRVGEGVLICESVLHPDVVVGRGARLRRCVVEINSHIGNDCDLESMVVGAGAVLPRGTRFESELQMLSET